MPQFEDENEVKGYFWPASALTRYDMAILVDLREQTGMPISKLLRQSVRTMNTMKAALLKIANSDENDLGMYAKECERTALLALKEVQRKCLVTRL